MRILESNTYSGYFWLPEEDSLRVPGTLHIDTNGEITLKIIGHLKKHDNSFSDETPAIGRIVGLIEGDDFVTLEGCFTTRTANIFSEIAKSDILVHSAYIGVIYEKHEAIEFDQLTFSVDGFDEWLRVSGIKSSFDFKSRTTTLTYQRPENIILHNSDKISLAINFQATTSGLPAVREAKITQKALLLVTGTKPIPINDILEYCRRVKNFFCFAINEDVRTSSLVGYADNIYDEAPDGRKLKKSIKIFFRSSPSEEIEKPKNWLDMLFAYHRVSDKITGALDGWLKNYEKSEPAFNLYFALKSGSQRHLEGKFLSLAQAIETLHRRNSEETLISDDAFKQRISDILSKCTEEQKDWLEPRLNHANELPLRKRIKRMIDPFSDLYGPSSERNSFISKVVNTRNYLTHYDKRAEEDSVKGKHLLLLIFKLEVLFQLHLLHLIGFNTQEIKKLAVENRSIQNKLNFSFL